MVSCPEEKGWKEKPRLLLRCLSFFFFVSPKVVAEKKERKTAYDSRQVLTIH